MAASFHLKNAGERNNKGFRVVQGMNTRFSVTTIYFKKRPR